MKNLYFLLTLTVLLLAACQSDEIDQTNNTPIYNPPQGELVDGTVRGSVVDTDGEGIEGALVNFNGKTETTDENGTFVMNGQLDAAGTYLRVTKAGYFDGSTKFNASSDATDFVNVQLVARELSGTVNTTSGGPVTLDDATVALPSGAYRNDDGQSYNGEVQVYAHYMDPTSPATFEQMPGDLTGFTTDGEIQGLVTYGMMNVELQDASGNNLQLPEGETATLTLPVPAELSNTAPAMIPLWYFDEEKGIWVEEGTAQLINGEYVGEVSHFTTWNCDDPFDFVCINGILDFNGDPAANFNLEFTGPSIGLSGYVTTNSRGDFSIKVPAGVELTLTVAAGCGSVAQDIPIGSYNADTFIGEISVSGTVEDFTIVGSVEMCGGGVVTNGVLEIYIDNNAYVVQLEADGSFDHTFSNCTGTNVTLTAIDRDASMESDLITLTASGFQDLGIIETCNMAELQDFVISYQGQNWALSSQDSTIIGTYTDQIVTNTGSPNQIIRTITVLDWLTSSFAEGTFVYLEGGSEATYIMPMPQGFQIAGTCPVQETPFFQVTDTSTSITVTDPTTYPAGGVDQVYFSFKF